jgi:hypothetical protein
MAEAVDAGFDREALAAQLRSIRDARKYGGVGAPAWARASRCCRRTPRRLNRAILEAQDAARAAKL